MAGFAGIAPRAVFLPVVYRPEMLGIVAVMDQKDSYALFLGSGMCKAWFAGIFPLALCSSCGSCPDALHHGRYGPEGQLRGEILADMVPVVQTAGQLWIFRSCSTRQGHQHPCPGADADSHGLHCLADHRDSPVPVVQGG